MTIITSSDVLPWGILHNDSLQTSIEIKTSLVFDDTERWKSVSHYIYSNVIPEPFLQNQIRYIIDPNNMKQKSRELYDATLQDITKEAIREAVFTLYDQNIIFKQAIEDVRDYNLTYVSDNLFLGSNNNHEGLNVFGQILMNMTESDLDIERKGEYLFDDFFAIGFTQRNEFQIQGRTFISIDDYVSFAFLVFFSNDDPWKIYNTTRSENPIILFEEYQEEYFNRVVEKSCHNALSAKFDESFKLGKLLKSFQHILFDTGFLSRYTNKYTELYIKDFQERNRVDPYNIINMFLLVDMPFNNDKLWIKDIRLPHIIRVLNIFYSFMSLNSDIVQTVLDEMFGKCQIVEENSIVEEYPFEFFQMMAEEVQSYENDDFTSIVMDHVVVYKIWIYVSNLLLSSYNYLVDSNQVSYETMFVSLEYPRRMLNERIIWKSLLNALNSIVDIHYRIYGKIYLFNLKSIMFILSNVFNVESYPEIDQVYSFILTDLDFLSKDFIKDFSIEMSSLLYAMFKTQHNIPSFIARIEYFS